MWLEEQSKLCKSQQPGVLSAAPSWDHSQDLGISGTQGHMVTKPPGTCACHLRSKHQQRPCKP